jgi:hypothetical protein
MAHRHSPKGVHGVSSPPQLLVVLHPELWRANFTIPMCIHCYSSYMGDFVSSFSDLLYDYEYFAAFCPFVAHNHRCPFSI